MKYELFADGRRIGWSALEGGDPPMGVASGRLITTEEYVLIRTQLPNLILSVRPEGGEFFQAAGIHIDDYSDELGEDGIEVTVLGLDSDTYNRYFSEHVCRYESLFSDS